MARITRVAKAQQRYATTPVIDPATGQQKQTPVMRKDGQQRVTKRGHKVFMGVTQRDTTKPLPNLRCDFPGCDIDGGEILPGTPYKHITPKSGPYGGRQRSRHQAHPDWNVWDYSDSLSANLQRISHDFWSAESGWGSPDDVQSALDEAAQEIRDLAEQKRESAQSIEDGFGHETYMSTELNETADALDGWADEVESAEIPELPEPEDEDCPECGGSGLVDNDAYDPEDEDSDEPEEVDCPDCEGTGSIPAGDDPTDEQMDDWRSEVQDAMSIVDESPV